MDEKTKGYLLETYRGWAQRFFYCAVQFKEMETGMKEARSKMDVFGQLLEDGDPGILEKEVARAKKISDKTAMKKLEKS